MFISKEVYKALLASGWSENRSLDKKIIEKELTLEGYPILENVIQFMQKFEGLIIHFFNLKNGIVNDDINLNFEHATHVETPGKIFKNYVPRINKQLCLIGTAYRDHFVLMMSNDGHVYGAYEDYLCLIGKSGVRALEAIILNYEFEEIP